MIILHHQGKSEEPSGGEEKEGAGKSGKGGEKSLNLNPRFSYLSYRRDYFRGNQAWTDHSHVSINVFSIFAARTCQVLRFTESFVLQNFSLPVLTVGNAHVGNVPFSPHGGGLQARRQNIFSS